VVLKGERLVQRRVGDQAPAVQLEHVQLGEYNVQWEVEAAFNAAVSQK
jgi:hypothetical protein